MLVTGWLAHTTRAALTGLRKKAFAIEKFKGEDGATRYRIDHSAMDSDQTSTSDARHEA